MADQERAGLTPPQREALRLLVEHEHRKGRPLEAGDAGVYTGTWHDEYTVGIDYRTVRALARRGLVRVDGSGAVYDEPPDLYLTDEGRAHG